MEEIQASNMGVAKTSTSKGGKTWQRKPNRFFEDWIKLFLGSSNTNTIDDHVFVNPYALCRDVVCPGVTGSEPFKYFYYNREKKIPMCNG